MSPIDLQSHLAARSEVDPSSGCWNWKLSKDKNGYGKAKVDRKDVRAHRLSWMAFRGEIPAGAVYSVKVRKTWANVQGEQQ